jgi:hypothetical protein
MELINSSQEDAKTDIVGHFSRNYFREKNFFGIDFKRLPLTIERKRSIAGQSRISTRLDNDAIGKSILGSL